MDAKELRAKKPEELNEELLKLRKEQFALRLQRATGQAVKPDQFGKVRKNIARLKTVARETRTASAAGVKK
ncbi:MAG: 50S ribosomal protein L29 [Gammaproteobacteria bacterium]